jgi:hypothetical protein
MISKMDVNAAIEGLIRDQDITDPNVQLIVEFSNTLPIKNWFSGESFSWSQKDDSVTGRTEYGDLTIRDAHETTEERSFGIRKERIGYYKVWRTSRTRLCFQFFWKADLSTWAEERPMTYHLRYDSETLTPTYFGREYERVIFSLPLPGGSRFSLINMRLKLLPSGEKIESLGWMLKSESISVR